MLFDHISHFEIVSVKITIVYLLETCMATPYVITSFAYLISVFLSEPSKFITSTTDLVVKYNLPADASTASPRTAASREQSVNRCHLRSRMLKSRFCYRACFGVG